MILSVKKTPDKETADNRSLSSARGAHARPEPPSDPSELDRSRSVAASAGLISACVMASRLTGFARTWAMAFALGSTLLSSSYQVANTLPNLLYELVVGGMIVTAFLPVYMSVKEKGGAKAGNAYASNLLTMVILLLGIISALCMIFPQAIIYTQSFYTDQSKMATSVFLFQFFAIQIVFYGASAIISGLLNANRDYLWSSIAPVANNIVVIATFILYAIVAPQDQMAALYIIAIGNPLGVFVQMAMQIPALRRNGVHVRPRIDIHDPAIKETLMIGVPALLVMVCSFAITSVQNAASYGFAENGPSILAYSRLWFTLPYAFLAVPITTAMFTELSAMHTKDNIQGVKRGIVRGTGQILFFMIPFAMYLIVFSYPLITLYHAGAFEMDDIRSISSYLAVLAVALPFYGVNTYLQKAFSTLRKMHIFLVVNLIATAVQIGLTMLAASNTSLFPIELIAVAEAAFFAIADVMLFIYLRKALGSLGFASVVRCCIISLVLGAIGALLGSLVSWAIQLVLPIDGNIAVALLCIVCGGIVSLAATFGPAIALGIPEAGFIRSLFSKAMGKLRRS